MLQSEEEIEMLESNVGIWDNIYNVFQFCWRYKINSVIVRDFLELKDILLDWFCDPSLSRSPQLPDC